MECNFEANKKVEPFYALRVYHRNHSLNPTDIHMYGMQEDGEREGRIFETVWWRQWQKLKEWLGEREVGVCATLRRISTKNNRSRAEMLQFLHTHLLRAYFTSYSYSRTFNE